MQDVDLKQISVFMAVRELGGLTAAQERLGMGVSAISKTLADLEVRLGCKLCQRGRSGFRITNEGERFYDASLKLHSSLRSFKSDTLNLKHSTRQNLRIGIVDSTISDPNNPLSNILHRLRTNNKNLDIQIKVASSVSIADQLLSDELDIGITYQQGARMPLQSLQLYLESLVWVAREQHPFLKHNNDNKLQSPVQRILSFGVASFKDARECAELFGDSSEAEIVQWEHFGKIEEVLWRISTSDRIGLVPKHAMTGDLCHQRFDMIAPKIALNSPMFLVYRDDKPQSPIARLMIKDISEQL